MPIVPARGTALLGFVSGRYDMAPPYAVTIPLLKDIKSQAASAVCEVAPMNNSTNLIVNSEAPPFNNAEIRRAMLLTIDRKSFIDILAQGAGEAGGVMEPAPGGVWGMPKEMFDTVKGYGPDVAKNRAEAQAIMKKLGYGPDNKLKLKVATRNHLLYRDPAVILIDQLKEIYIEGELDLVDTALWFNKVARKDYSVGSTPPATASTIPTRPTSSTMLASRSATMSATAIPRSRSSSRSSRRSATSRSARSSSGRSTSRSWRRASARSSCGTPRAAAGIPTSRGSARW